MLELKNISIILGKNTKLERPIIQDLTLTVASGEFVVIIGDNGAGKSTLFNAVSGNIPLESGSIYVDGINLSPWPAYKRPSLVSKVLQDPRIATIDTMTLEENLSFAYLRGHRRKLTPHKTKERLSLFQERVALLGMGLENRLEEPAFNLSGGQRQALSLIMAILADSKVLLLDEITAALDPKMANLVMELTSKIVQEYNRTTLMITHNMVHALQYGDRTILMQKGKIIREFHKEEKQALKPADLASIFGEI